jgi:hypothetical protein
VLGNDGVALLEWSAGPATRLGRGGSGIHGLAALDAWAPLPAGAAVRDGILGRVLRRAAALAAVPIPATGAVLAGRGEGGRRGTAMGEAAREATPPPLVPLAVVA